jgi:hypothetical protein
MYRRGLPLSGRLLARRLASTEKAVEVPPGKPKTFTHEHFYEPISAEEAVSALGVASRLRSVLLVATAATAAVYVGVNAAPVVGAGSVTQACRLLHARDHFMQRTGCSRLSLLLRGPTAMGDAAAAAGAGEALLALLCRYAFTLT